MICCVGDHLAILCNLHHVKQCIGRAGAVIVLQRKGASPQSVAVINRQVDPAPIF